MRIEGLRIEGLEFRVWGLGFFRFLGFLGLRVVGFGLEFRGWGLRKGLWVPGSCQ